MTGATAAVALTLAVAAVVRATPTEHHGIIILPARAGMTIDGDSGDWDLSAGVFVCGDVQGTRDDYALWLHAQWDEQNLYVLARWIDPTPLDNPGHTAGDAGFKGDCLQFRTIVGPRDAERVSHVTAWRGSDGADLIGITYGRDFKGGDVRDAAARGARQAFRVRADGRGYTQEAALPWALLTTDGRPPRDVPLQLTVEANFTTPNGRLTLKDLFRPGVQPDRIFTFRAFDHWGPATLAAHADATPRPVRLADGRTFPVALSGGVPVVDWSGLAAPAAPRGVASIPLHLSDPGVVSLVVRDAEGQVVRHLINAQGLQAGDHTLPWDGLATAAPDTKPAVAPAGRYTWEALQWPGGGLRPVLRGWAGSGGALPWDGPGGRGGWGGDHGEPAAVDSDERGVYLGWSGSEAGRAVVALDAQGQVRWRQTHGGMGGADALAIAGGVVYVIDHGATLYRLDAATGRYAPWDGRPSAERKLVDLAPEPKAPATGLAADAKYVYVAFREHDRLVVLDAATGAVVRSQTIASPTDLKARDGTLFVLSGNDRIVALAADGTVTPVLAGLPNAHAFDRAADGTWYVGVRGPGQQVRVYDAAGQLQRTIGRPGGRATLGRWTPDGVFNIAALRVDDRNDLWVMERDTTPKRVSRWDAANGQLQQEYFGPTHYGASGGAIHPLDPTLMVGSGCEWRIDPRTGRASIAGVVERRLAGVSRFAVVDGRVYLVTFKHHKTAPGGGGGGSFDVFLRRGEGDYRRVAGYDAATLELWSDADGDGERQPSECQTAPTYLTFTGYYAWSHTMADDLSLLGLARGRGPVMLQCTGVMASGAPTWDLSSLRDLPLPRDAGLPYPSHDGKLALVMGGKAFGERWACVELDTGRVRWTYPNPFQGVHGSHRAPPPSPGLIRGAFGVIGAGASPTVGRWWIINTNKGEWHALSEHGFYLGHVFEGDLLKVRWPADAAPGTDLSLVPPGSGEEDFGGSVTQLADGRVFLQTGKTSLWNVELLGLGAARPAGHGELILTEADAERARAARDATPHDPPAPMLLVIPRAQITLTGDMDADFADVPKIVFGPEGQVTAQLANDGQRLYRAVRVRDDTPWVNDADLPQHLYARGDTIDLQLGANPDADPRRTAAVIGDLRLSIGPCRGRNLAVLYRERSDDPRPMTFSSGVVPSFVVQRVEVLDDLPIHVSRGEGRFTVQVALPLDRLGLTPGQAAALRGDVGVTLGRSEGGRTGARVYWSNTAAGLVSDEVYELKLDPSRWGQMHIR